MIGTSVPSLHREYTDSVIRSYKVFLLEVYIAQMLGFSDSCSSAKIIVLGMQNQQLLCCRYTEWCGMRE